MTIERFVAAQDPIWERALGELRSGSKRSHWMWFVFPQIAGLGMSAMSQTFALADRDEARAYLSHAVLGPRLFEAVAAAEASGVRDAVALFGSVDAVKFRSSLTLFAAVADDPAVFEGALQTFFAGERDPETIKRL